MEVIVSQKSTLNKKPSGIIFLTENEISLVGSGQALATWLRHRQILALGGRLGLEFALRFRGSVQRLACVLVLFVRST